MIRRGVAHSANFGFVPLIRELEVTIDQCVSREQPSDLFH
jgi:hypothetical protein